MSGWVLASERLPTDKEMAAFSRCEVILQCNQQNAKPGDEPWQAMRIGWLTFLGGDRSRPLWLEGENKGGAPIENGAWFVTHWRPFPKFPPALTHQTAEERDG